jgi:hypothetical protein
MSAIKCGSCGFGSIKKRNFGSGKKGKKKVGKKKVGKKRSFGKRFVKKSRRFGKIDSALNFMGNSKPNDMSIFQQYTGMPPGQMETRLTQIPTNLRSNFYANIPKA